MTPVTAGAADWAWIAGHMYCEQYRRLMDRRCLRLGRKHKKTLQNMQKIGNPNVLPYIAFLEAQGPTGQPV